MASAGVHTTDLVRHSGCPVLFDPRESSVRIAMTPQGIQGKWDPRLPIPGLVVLELLECRLRIVLGHENQAVTIVCPG
jgi:hypothetical protein